MRRIFYAFIAFGLLSLQALPARAQTTPSSNVFISEINWAGSSLSQADEWIELYNASGASVDLSGWVLTGSASSGEALAIAEGTVIEPESTLLIANYALGNEKTSLTVDPHLTTASLSLSNSAQEIILADADGTIIDQVGDGGGPEAGSTNPITSMQRDLVNKTWSSTTQSLGLNDPAQLGTPGTVPSTSTQSSSVEETEVVEEIEAMPKGEVAIELTPDQLATCSAMFLPPITTSEPTAADAASVQEDQTSFELTIPDTTALMDEAENNAAANETSDEEKTDEDVAEEVVLEAPTSYAPGSVVINEFVSDPQDGEEWVELLNVSSETIDLSGWILVEGSGKETTLADFELAAGDYTVVSPIKGNLNNGGDTITVFDASGGQIDSLTYGDEPQAPKKGESLSRSVHGEWVATDPTPGRTNVLYEINTEAYEQTTDDTDSSQPANDSQDEHQAVSTTESDSSRETSVVSNESKIYTVTDVAEPASKQTKETNKQPSATTTTTSFEGVITATPDTFGSQIAFVDGMQLYFYHANWPELSVGDMVRVSGEPSIAWDESRLKLSDASDITVLRSGSIEPIPLSINDVFSQDIGSLVEIKGAVSTIDGKMLTLSDDSAEIEVVANERAGMTWSDLRSSAYTITGIVRTRNGEMQLYVRDWDDVRVSDEAAISAEDVQDADLAGVSVDSDTDIPWMGTIILGIGTSALVYWVVKFKLPNTFTQTVTS